jgi:hypothetical protein
MSSSGKRLERLSGKQATNDHTANTMIAIIPYKYHTGNGGGVSMMDT